jgi:survival-of-motor-neuron-related-splicing factor 30
MEASQDQIQEYESQLANIAELLKASPDDEGLLGLKKDLEELLALTKASLPATTAATATAASSDHQDEFKPAAAPSALEAAVASLPDDNDTTTTTETATAAPDEQQQDAAAAAATKKKKRKIKEFEVPEHLQTRETDTEKEKIRKRRAIKSLKSKWREKQKETESANKQASWQSFQSKKSNKRKDKSIFATQDGVDARVGVVSAKSMTEFGERKRHKS